VRRIILELRLAGFLLKEDLSKKKIEEDHLRRVSFGINIVFSCRSSQKNPKGLRDQRWTGVELIPSGELSFKTETQTRPWNRRVE
jgi:hypothetical protein